MAIPSVFTNTNLLPSLSDSLKSSPLVLIFINFYLNIFVTPVLTSHSVLLLLLSSWRNEQGQREWAWLQHSPLSSTGHLCYFPSCKIQRVKKNWCESNKWWILGIIKHRQTPCQDSFLLRGPKWGKGPRGSHCWRFRWGPQDESLNRGV